MEKLPLRRPRRPWPLVLAALAAQLWELPSPPVPAFARSPVPRRQGGS